MTKQMPIKQATEREEQSALIDWWQRYAPSRGIAPALLYAIPNGAVLAGDAGARARQVNALKRQGLRPCVPDLALDVARGVYHGLRIEMKRAGWVRPGSDHERAQAVYLAMLAGQGYRAVFCAGCEDAMREIGAYLRLSVSGVVD